MSTQTAPLHIDVNLLADIKSFGAGDVLACFSCGNCTAICPMATNDGAFPRRMIRYGQVGMKDALLSSKELWTCYHCGLCSDSCPQQADPGGYMAAARRYAIANYDRTRLARALYTKPVFSSIFTVALALFISSIMFAARGPRSTSSLDFFNFIPDQRIHWIGIGVMILALVASLSGIVMMVTGIARSEGVHLSTIFGGRSAAGRALKAVWVSLGVESLGQRRFRDDCAADQSPEPWYQRRWLIHAATMWGFLGLFAATLLDYALALLGIKKTGAPVPIWYPVRLLGTLSGLAMVFGLTMLILHRIQGNGQAAKNSKQSDWMLLIFLWIIGVSGFLIEIGLYLPHVPTWGYWVFLFHVAIAMELILLTPFMKFAHVLYRPVALFFHALAAEPVK
jgi:nitrate reductase gamma subunit/ferredoxin